MTEEDIVRGFWHFNPEKEWPPKKITKVDEYKGGDRLNLDITQQSYLSAYQQTQLVKKWCDYLPELTKVKYIWFTSKVNQKTFEAVCEMPNLEGIWIKWSGIKNIDKIVKLKSLKHFHLGSSSQIESIARLADMNSLITLELEHIKKINGFEPISKCLKLEGLAIEGSMWSTQEIKNLKPIEKLKNLKYLSLMNTKVLDASLKPLLQLKQLKRFDSSLNIPSQEITNLKKIKTLEFGNVPAEYLDVKTQVRNKLKWL
ncbi:hypothetical protein [Maribacter sp. IgM3_T14_3]|uniref:hypothetical protein n=1 Tax=Maribacter sp. IgM3_T14_3 TaxID=3415140 RepID=UPI003C6FFE0B